MRRRSRSGLAARFTEELNRPNGTCDRVDCDAEATNEVFVEALNRTTWLCQAHAEREVAL